MGALGGITKNVYWRVELLYNVYWRECVLATAKFPLTIVH